MQNQKNVGGQTWLEYHPKLFEKLMQLMTDSEVITSSELSHIPDDISALKKLLKLHPQLDEQWQSWLKAGATSSLTTAIWLRYRQR